VVVDTDAVIKPGAVMIEPLHAHTANVAMTAAKGFYHLALSANFIRIEFLKNFDKLNVLGWLKHTRVLSRSHDKRNEHFDANHRSGNCIVPSRVVCEEKKIFKN
jgi:hypothetical protein